MNTANPASTSAPEVRLERTVLRVARELDWAKHTPAGIYARFGRRCVDAALLLACLPISIGPALCIACVNLIVTRDVRKILYTQKRVGLRGKIFRIYKFRTMRDAVESDLDSWASGRDRDRVTWFGRFLRSSHLDELPQLINVVIGDMSFIGPRPEMVEIEEWAASAVPGFMTRLAIRPGITGFAQITQGYTEQDARDYQRKLELCTSYNESLSPTVDISILWQTAIWMLRGKGWQWKSAENRLAQTALRIVTAAEKPDVDSPAAALPTQRDDSHQHSGAREC